MFETTNQYTNDGFSTASLVYRRHAPHAPHGAPGSPPIQCRQSQDGASSRVAGAEIGRIGREQGTSLKPQGAGEMCENSGIYGDILWDLQELDTINGFWIANFIVFLENWKFHRENRASPMDLGPMNGIFQGESDYIFLLGWAALRGAVGEMVDTRIVCEYRVYIYTYNIYI